MVTSRLSCYLVGIFALCYVSTIGLVFCSATDAAPGIFKVSTPPPAVCAILLRTLPVVGNIKSVSPQALQINKIDDKGKIIGTINATYNPKTTHIIQLTQQKLSVLQKGDHIFFQAKQNANGSYTALSISQVPNDMLAQASKQAGPGGLMSMDTAKACFASGQGPKAGSAITSLTVGTVSQISGNTLVVMDEHQKSHTISVPTGMQITQPTPATFSALKPNAAVMVQGLTTNGVIAASVINIASSPDMFTSLSGMIP